MPVIVKKTLHSFSSEDPQFPAKNLLETKVTKKWKCKDVGEKSCFVVLKLDQPRLITGIDIGNERSGFIEVLVGNSLQDQPEFKEILLATSFMTIVEAKNGLNPNRVRCFSSNNLVESVAKEKWDLVKIICAQIYNSRDQYGLSFVTLHTSETIVDEDSPQKTAAADSKPRSSEKRKSFGKFTLRGDSGSESDDDRKKKTDALSPFERWKASKSGNSQGDAQKSSIRDQVKAKIEQNRKRIRVMSDSSDEEQSKAKAKPNRNRTSGLLYEDDEPNEKLQKKLDKDREARDSKSSRRDKTPPKPSESKSSKFASFISDDAPSSSQKPSSSSSTSSKPKDSKSSSTKSPKSSHHHSKSSSSKSPRSSHHSSSRSTPRSAEKKTSSKPVTYKPFHKLLEGVTFVLSGYVNPERGSLRQKALDMGAKYKQDWDSSCTHLICAVSNTPKHQQVRGKGKIVTKRWVEACFSEQKRLPWRRYALDRSEKDEPESEDEIHNVLNQPKSPLKSASKSLAFQSDSDDDMVVVDKRVGNGSDPKADKSASADLNESDDVQILPEAEPLIIDLDDGQEPNNNEPATQKSAIDVSTDDELMEEVDLTHIENQVYKSKTFFLNDDLPATDVIKLNNQITAMEGRVTGQPAKADFIVTKTGHKLPQGVTGEVLTALWVYECYELGAMIPTTRYKPKVN